MHLRSVRLILVAVLLGAGLAAGLLTWSVERRITDLDRAEQEIGRRLDRMQASVPAIALAQQAYVAPGQADGPWLEQAATHIQTLSNDTAALRALTRSQDAGSLLQNIAGRLTAVVDVDARARESLRAGDDLMASDLIYSEGHQTLDATARDLRTLRAVEHGAFSGQRAALRGEAWTALGAAALLWLIGVALLVRRPAAAPPVPMAPPEETVPNFVTRRWPLRR